MNSVAPCVAAEARAAARSARAGGADGAAARRRGRCTVGRGRSVGSSSTARAGELPAPAGDLALQHLPVQPAALPGGEVGVLDRQRRAAARPAARDPRAIEGGQLAHEDADRPAVEDDVVEREEHARGRSRRAQQEAAQQRAAREVERPAAPRRARGGAISGPCRSRGERRAGRPRGSSNGAAGSDHLHGLAVDFGEGGAQASWRRRISSRAPREGGDVERSRADGRPRACCRRRPRLRAGRGTTGAPGRRRAARRPSRGTRDDRRHVRRAARRAAASRSRRRPRRRVGASKNARSGSSTPNAWRTREIGLGGEQGVAAEREEVVFDADPLDAEQLLSRSPRSRSSVALRGAT